MVLFLFETFEPTRGRDRVALKKVAVCRVRILLRVRLIIGAIINGKSLNETISTKAKKIANGDSLVVSHGSIKITASKFSIVLPYLRIPNAEPDNPFPHCFP
jgi:hypothetical protein